MMMPFESAVRGSLEGSHGGRLDAHNEADHRAVTPLYGALLVDRLSSLKNRVSSADSRRMSVANLLPAWLESPY